MKIRYLLCAALVAGLFIGCASEHCEKCGKNESGKEEGEGGSQAKLMAEAKVSQADAQRIALAEVPGGAIKEGGIEREKGKLIWSFDIATPGTKNITEVAVDALTGKVLSKDIETPSDEAKEKKQEKEDDEKEEKK